MKIAGKKHIFRILILTAALLAISLSSCRHPDGNIGHLLGNWQIERIEADGEPISDYKGDIMISFQGDIFLMAYVNGSETFGTWSRTDDSFNIKADYNAGSAKEMPSILGFGPDRVLRFDLLEFKPKHMTWRRVNYQGRVYTYYLKKLL